MNRHHIEYKGATVNKVTLIIGASAVMLFAAACGDLVNTNTGAGVGGQDNSAAIVNSIQTGGAGQLTTAEKAIYADASVTISNVHCTETGTSQAYVCAFDFTVTAPAESITQKYNEQATASCDSQGNCQWHDQGNGVPIPG